MVTQLVPQRTDASPGANQPSIDPLRRIFVPIERMTSSGASVFMTTDKEQYVRLPSGVIRRAHPKVNGKRARKVRITERRAYAAKQNVVIS